MKVAKTLVTVSVLLGASMALTVGCGTTSRYKADEFGPKQEGKMDVALANIDKAMGDMAATKKRAMAKQAEALRLGKELFYDTNLGTNGQSCNSCHPGGGTTGGEAHVAKKMGHGPYELPIPSLIGASARFPKYKIPNDEVVTLAQMDNNCIRMFLSGKRLPLNSPESFYLATYLSSFSNGDEVQVAGSK